MEAFIERSNALLFARPDTTRVSTRYTHKHAAEKGERVDNTAKAAKVVIKTQDIKTGMVYKYKTKKHQELSRILASLGPQFFEFGGDHKKGAASIMSGVEPVMEPVEKPAPESVSASAAQAASSKSEAAEPKGKSKKKKSKKH